MQLLMETLIDLVQLSGMIYFWIVIARVFSTWVNADPYSPVMRFLYQATEPLLSRIRRVVPTIGMFDLSPIVLILGVQLLTKFLVRLLAQLAYGM